MLVVADTTPIISLLKIGRLDLLEKLFKTIKIPKAVFQELTSNSQFSKEAEIIKNCVFFDFIEVANNEAVNTLQKETGLDRGESEAIVLAKEINSDLILLDEEAGRTVASKIGLAIMGTVGILIAARKQNFISSEDVKKAAETFRKTGRFLSESLYKQLLELKK